MLGHRIERWFAVVLPREERDPEDQEADDGRDRPVDPLDPGVGVVERRDQLAMAQGPVGAAHPGVGHPHDHPDRDEQDRRDDRSEGESSGSGSRAVWADLGTRARARRGRGAAAHSTHDGPRAAPGDSRVRGRLRLRSVHAPHPPSARSPCSWRPSPCWPPPCSPAPSPSPSAVAAPSVIPVHPRRAGEGPVPVRLLVPRRDHQPARRRPRPQGLGGVPGARRLG